MAEDRRASLTLAQAVEEYLDWQALDRGRELGDPHLTAEFLGHHGLGSVAGYTEVSWRRHEEAADALRRRGV